MPDINTVFRDAQKRLREAGVEAHGREAGLLLGDVLGLPLESLLLFKEREFDERLRPELDDRLKRRIDGEPVQYILGEWEFMGLPFYVTPDALIPRQDTETLVEQALELLREKRYETALDLCCGTGCIGVSVAALGGISVTMSDISAACVELARKNASRNKVHERVSFAQGDLFAPLKGQTFDMILSNPPYIPDDEINALQKEVQREPRIALAGGADGLSFYRRIAKEYREYLNPQGVLLLEVGWMQSRAVREMFSVPTLMLEDLNGIPRVMLAMG